MKLQIAFFFFNRKANSMFAEKSIRIHFYWELQEINNIYYCGLKCFIN
jgi:hypothetical protein